MDKKEKKIFFLLLGLFFVFYFMPLGSEIFKGAIFSGLGLLNEYAKEHVITCLLPAFFIAGAIAVFIKKDLILHYLGGNTNKSISYSVASVSGAILAVCSCTILPLFAGIRKRGAGLGPATTFLFSGPAINIAAIFLTISVLGVEIGTARIIGAVVLAILVGLSMQLIFKEKPEKGELFLEDKETLDIKKNILFLFFLSMIGVIILNGLAINLAIKYFLMTFLILIIVGIVIFKFKKEVTSQWLRETWSFTKTLLPILFAGVFFAGFVMPFIPQEFIEEIVGKNSLIGNLTASIFGAFVYFSTLSEIPILQALIEKGMSNGPALALLLAGPSLSLPNMMVIRSILGNRKTGVYILLVVIYSTIAGLIFGGLF